MRIPIAISNRHIFLSPQDAKILFGKWYIFTQKKKLSQPNLYSTQEYITLKWPKGEISKVRVLGPNKKHTQVSILFSDNFTLGINAPINDPEDFSNSEKITIIWPQGEISLSKWAIIPQRHIRMTVAESEEFWLKNWDIVKIKIKNNKRWLIFDNVIVKVKDKYVLDFFIDREEANSAWLEEWAWGEIIR